MKNWIRRRLYRFLNSGEPQDNSLDHEKSLRFNVVPAAGGTILELRTYDPVNDRSKVYYHVIPSDTDAGEAIGRIVYMELLRL
jgi:hypothetical protein